MSTTPLSPEDMQEALSVARDRPELLISRALLQLHAQASVPVDAEVLEIARYNIGIEDFQKGPNHCLELFRKMQAELLRLAQQAPAGRQSLPVAEMQPDEVEALDLLIETTQPGPGGDINHSHGGDVGHISSLDKISQQVVRQHRTTEPTPARTAAEIARAIAWLNNPFKHEEHPIISSNRSEVLLDYIATLQAEVARLRDDLEETQRALEVEVGSSERLAAVTAERDKWWGALKSYHQPKDEDNGRVSGQNAVIEAMFARFHPQGKAALNTKEAQKDNLESALAKAAGGA